MNNPFESEQRQAISQMLDEAIYAMDHQRWPEAVAKLDHIMDFDPDFPGARWRQSEAHMRRHLETAYEQAFKRMRDGQWSEAIRSLRVVQRQSPEFRNTYVLLRICQRKIAPRTTTKETAGSHVSTKVVKWTLTVAGGVVLGCACYMGALTLLDASGTPDNLVNVIPTRTIPAIVNVLPTSVPTSVENGAETPSALEPTPTPTNDTGMGMGLNPTATIDPQVFDPLHPLPTFTPTRTPTRIPTRTPTRVATISVADLPDPTDTPIPIVRTATGTPTQAATPTKATATAVVTVVTGTPAPTDTATQAPTPAPQPTNTAAPTNTTIPTDVPEPTHAATAVPPTATLVPPTATLAPATSTSTPVPPTATPRPPTATRQPTATRAPTTVPLNITALDYRFQPSSASFAVGTKVRITLANGGDVDHNLVLKNPAGREILRITVLPLQQAYQEYTFQTAGTYAFVCDLSDHQQRGMVGSISIH